MLVRFSVRNYWCFREQVEIDFTDKRNYDFGKECVRGDFLEKVVILGGNGSGKTSFGYAIMDIVTTVTGFTKDIGQHTEACFINGDSGSDRATFRYEFSWHGTSVVYEYGKTSPFRVVSESLTVDRRSVFSYDLDDPDASFFEPLLAEVVGSDASCLDGSKALMKVLHDMPHRDDSPMCAVFDFAEHSLYYRAMWRMDDHIGMMDHDVDPSVFIMENGLIDEFEQFLRGVGGVDISVGCSGGGITVATGTKESPFYQGVSRGTAILSRLYVWIMRCRDRDSLIFFDDFDDLFDYRTAENVMDYIIRGSDAQCVFVTHNVELVSCDHMRPDCCFIMGHGCLSSLSSLTGKNIRRGNNLAKMVREGKFSTTDDNERSEDL